MKRSWFSRIADYFVSRLSRETSSGSFIPEIDGMRFIAISAVMVYHVTNLLHVKAAPLMAGNSDDDWVWRIADQGFIGVQCFFVVSAFVVALPFARRYMLGGPAVRLPYYFTRRVTRLEPPYFIHLLFAYVVAIVVEHHEWKSLIPHLWASVIYSHHFIYGTPNNAMNFGLWSLEIEVQFYVLAPLLTKVFAIRSPHVRRMLLTSAIVGFASLQWVLPGAMLHDGAGGWTLLNKLHFFLLGFLILDLYLSGSLKPGAMAGAWDLLALTGLAGVPLVMFYRIAPQLCVPPMFLLIFCGAFRGKVFRWFLRQPLIYTLGGMCYTIYLYHGWVMSAVGKASLRMVFHGPYWANAVAQLAVMIPVMFMVCAVLFVLFERPFMNRHWPVDVLTALGLKANRLATPDPKRPLDAPASSSPTPGELSA